MNDLHPVFLRMITQTHLRPELLAPAGDWDCVRAAVENGADAIYLGLDCGFNARHRAKNFHLDDLDELTSLLRLRGVRGYVTMNTLVFPSEMPSLVRVVERIAEAGIDAILVQDFGVARLARKVCPELEIHASTQMSLTSAETIAVAQELGLSRVVLPRELSVGEIGKIREKTDMPLEAFIHGALCVAYSGQCLTSESLGGRSANRGQCAQACRLPYDLICDGEELDLGAIKYLLSPQDLAGYAAIPDMIRVGIASLKIEGRLKTPEYVANITGHYRRAIDQAMDLGKVDLGDRAKQEMELSFSRGFSPGWLEGNDHKRLVPGRHSAKRGVLAGRILDVAPHRIQVQLGCDLALGDGVAIARDGEEQGFQGGRVYSLDIHGESVRHAEPGNDVWIGFGRGDVDTQHVEPGQTVFKNDDPKLNRRLRQTFAHHEKKTTRKRTVDLNVRAECGRPLELTAVDRMTGFESRGNSEAPLQAARTQPATETMLREKLGRLGATPFQLGNCQTKIDGAPMVPVGVLNQLRRDVLDQLTQQIQVAPTRHVSLSAGERFLKPIQSETESRASEQKTPAAKPQLIVLCRTMDQLRAAAEAGADWVYADFHDPRDYHEAVQFGRDTGVAVGLATVRMQKPGEFGLIRTICKRNPDRLLARNLAALRYANEQGIPTVADFSLNLTNHRSVEWVMDQSAQQVTASYDLNRDQLMDLVSTVPPAWLEIVIHQHVPMFHMEHCVFCSVLSPGTNKTNCGRPCDRHVVHLRDRVGAEHPLQADIACRNTLYNASPQSGAEIVGDLIDRGIRSFRIELLEENAKAVKGTVALYQGLLSGEIAGSEVWRRLGAINRVGVTRGTLETKRNPLAIL